MSAEDIAKNLHPLERKVLPFLKDGICLFELVEISRIQEVEVMRAVQWLENKALIKIETDEKEFLYLDKNGMLYRNEGLPEKRFLSALKEKPLSLTELGKKSGLDRDELTVSLGLLKASGAIDIKKERELILSITVKGRELLKGESPEEKILRKDFPLDFGLLSDEEKNAALALIKRKDILKRKKKRERTIHITALGERVLKAGISGEGIIDRLEPFMLREKSWKDKEFRAYDVEINVPRIAGGKRHFTNQALEYIKSIWLELGFKEMAGSLVQTSFWDLDALFVPQDHPAREMQDTFYIKEPGQGRLPAAEIVSKVKKTHEDGWTTGSRGWQYEWRAEKAKENLLRTHTTVLSARYISKLKKEELPAKFFAVGKCFRNETLDWKHLFEFYQVEGIVVDEDANFSNLLGYLKEFFRKMGYPDVRIRPGYFPYTEPSAEVDVFDPSKGEWVELGGSGIFRPEVVKPLFGIAVPVLAWGLGLDRLIKENWDIRDIRELYRNDLKQLREAKIWLR